jgi:hypothetical protein
LISAALADRHFIFVLSAALAEPLGAGNFWPTIVLAAELATAAELPGRADRRPGSRFAAWGALSTFYNHSARTRARVDRYSCLISAAPADRHFIFAVA